ncbi:hypothetical protein DEJ49_33465 [Streptomyces venezuelae]|uniref:Uncharacterized protein n=1 Tax=Streptomyces venezuelae TaxID=54571 RepID=A0A5P2CSH5_STRVZ|nr:hypothetical protein [Streptomyces venezuelae]QES45250.1 hypothetical protein DEJ49_33465 [Streptomyces venezuelae]
MAWSASAIFREWVAGPMLQSAGTSFTGLDSDTVKVSLHNNSITPDKDAAVGSTGFNTGQWSTTNEVVDATNWASGGRTLASKTFTTPSTGVAMFDAADLAGGGPVTLANVYGCFVYDDTITGGTVADQGVCYNYFGGSQSVTAGTFTIVFNSNGIARFTV